MKFTKKTTQVKRAYFDKLLNQFFNVVEWAIYIVFCIIAVYFMQDALNQYQAKDTFMAQSLKPISKLPTIVACVNSNKAYQYGTTLKILYGKDKLSELKENQSLFIESTNETITFQQMKVNCFGISSTIDTEDVSGQRRFVKLIAKGTVLPTSVRFYFTSEDNTQCH